MSASAPLIHLPDRHGLIYGDTVMLYVSTFDLSKPPYLSPAEIESLDLMEHHRERIRDALAGQAATFVR